MIAYIRSDIEVPIIEQTGENIPMITIKLKGVIYNTLYRPHAASINKKYGCTVTDEAICDEVIEIWESIIETQGSRFEAIGDLHFDYSRSRDKQLANQFVNFCSNHNLEQRIFETTWKRLEDGPNGKILRHSTIDHWYTNSRRVHKIID